MGEYPGLAAQTRGVQMNADEIRRYMEAAMGKLSPKKAQELANSLRQGQGKEQVTKAAHDLMDWSNKSRERLTELIRSEVRSQLKQVGVASRDEVDALRRRVRDLEKAKDGRKRTTAKRSTAKRTTAKRTTAARSTTPPMQAVAIETPSEPSTPAGTSV
jgi:polyhydroxyalkanoate synthesis regulator phasin